jgi:hypothetical protein
MLLWGRYRWQNFRPYPAPPFSRPWLVKNYFSCFPSQPRFSLSNWFLSTTSRHDYAWNITLQSQEILNRPVFVLEILKSVLKFWKLLKILKRFWTDSEHCWTFWTDSEHCWNFWTDSENSENCWKFWTDSEQILNIAENSEQILNNIFLLK